MEIIDINKVGIYGLKDSFDACQYSFATDVNEIIPSEKPLLNCAKAPLGSGHNNALKGIIVQFDLTFSNKAWVEAERYHWFEPVMSQSTMHKITKFDLDKAYNKYVDKGIIKIIKRMVDDYNNIDVIWGVWEAAGEVDSNGKYNGMTKEEYKNDLYLRILYSNPAGMMLTARMTTNYLQLKTIYHQRKNHRLPEWRELCAWIETLPRAKELICN